MSAKRDLRIKLYVFALYLRYTEHTAETRAHQTLAFLNSAKCELNELASPVLVYEVWSSRFSSTVVEKRTLH